MRIISIVVTGLFMSFYFPQEVIKGKVVDVPDGNTIEILTDENESYKIELARIDCPELQQPFGIEAKHFLEKTIKGKKVEAIIEGKNRWGLLQAVVIPKDGSDPRLKLLAEGLAWTSEKNIAPELEAICADAKAYGKGLWRDKEPTPPWIFRRQQTMITPKFR